MTEHRPALLAFARRLVLDPELAEDLVQETYEAALHSQQRGVLPADPGEQMTWLRTVLRRREASAYRRRRAEEKSIARTPADTASEPAQGKALDASAAVVGLTPTRAEVLLRRAVFGQSYAEIAEVMGLLEVTARSHYFWAVRQAQSLLAR